MPKARAPATLLSTGSANVRAARRPGEPMHPFRFLAVVPTVLDATRLAQLGRRAESSGYSGVVVPDHLLDQPAPIPTLAAIAAATDRLRIGTLVLNNDLRHPIVLAHELATLDIISGGRLDIGLGAGWNVAEYSPVGLQFDPISTRVERLTETLVILKGCFADAPFSYSGSHFTIAGYDARPKPIQRPHPPLLIAGGGRRTLELAAREADIVGLAPRLLSGRHGDPRSLTLEATAEKIDWVRRVAGDRFAALELNVYPSTLTPSPLLSPIRITDRPRVEAARLVDWYRARTGVALTEDEVIESPHVFIGSIDGLVEKLRSLRERLGISSFMVGQVGQLGLVVERLAGT